MSNEANEKLEVQVSNVVAETPKAVLCEIGGEEHWMPRSQIDTGGLRGVGSSGLISVPQWLVDAKKLNLDEDETGEEVLDTEVPNPHQKSVDPDDVPF